MSPSGQYVLALDQGTTSSRAIVFDRVGRVGRERPAGVPADLPGTRPRRARPRGDLVHAAADREARRSRRPASPPTDLAAIGITNQRETTVLWEKATGKPVANAIVWQSRVTAPICDRLKADGHEPTVSQEDRPGPRRVFLGHEDQAPARLVRRPARARGTRRDPVRHRRLVPDLAADRRQACHVTDVSNASRTLLFNIHTLRVGRRAAEAARRAAGDAARGAVVERGLRRNRSGAVRRGDSDRRQRRRSAGGAVRPGLLRAGHRRRTPTAPAASCC